MAMTENKILGLSGSLRKASINRALLARAATHLPDGWRLETFDVGALPHYSADLDGDPAEVQRLKEAIASAEGVLIATPEYNYGIPGVLKNALDWASRPAYRSVFTGKPVAIMGASPSQVGTARAQGQLKQVLLGMACLVYPSPELTVAGPQAKVTTDDGRVGDESTDQRLARLVTGFVHFVASAPQAMRDGS
jgi:chromate reductase